MQNKSFFAIGTMSGTSMDGVDVALIETNGEEKIKLLAHHSLTYPKSFHLQLKELEKITRHCANEYTDETLQKDKLLIRVKEKFKATEEIIQQSTEYHLQAIDALLEKINLSQAEIIIGYHGQTLLHLPTRNFTLQAGLPGYLAEKLHMKVVSDFRENDVMQGGQGAPFAPLLHRALILRDHLPLPAAVINCGGIANITLVTGKELTDIAGFDTGPGNVLLDQFVRQKTNDKETMDRDGQYALKGKIDKDFLKILFASACRKKDFYQLPPPKSLDTGDFTLMGSDPKSDEILLSIEDGCATLAAFTAKTIIQGLRLGSDPEKLGSDPTGIKSIILAGGGWYHPVIVRELLKELPLNTYIKTADEIGWQSAALEAQIFAYLAVRSLLNLPLSLPRTTGVAQPTLGGKVYNPS